MKTIIDILNGVSPAIAGYREKALDELTALQTQIAELETNDHNLRHQLGLMVTDAKNSSELEKERDEYAEETIRLQGEIRDRTVVVDVNTNLQKERDGLKELLTELCEALKPISESVKNEPDLDVFSDDVTFAWQTIRPLLVRARALLEETK